MAMLLNAILPHGSEKSKEPDDLVLEEKFKEDNDNEAP